MTSVSYLHRCHWASPDSEVAETTLSAGPCMRREGLEDMEAVELVDDTLLVLSSCRTMLPISVGNGNSTSL